ncbi:MAG: NAD(P)-dependent alcohol dehydrogenase [Chloroflexi bacterium]|nr:NAD(P)-dependent alcohol dehydrogenase [Chloroflexota bacterium]
MKAIVATRQGRPEVLELREVARPSPRADEILIRVHASTVVQGDVILRKLHPLLFILFRLFGIHRKRIQGNEFAGVVEEVGIDVTEYVPGDRVYGTSTGLKAGSNAEYLCVPERWKTGVVAKMPAKISFEEAAAIPIGAMTALDLLRKAKIAKGQRVLVYGASGSVGTYAVQLAKYFGAHVTGVASAANQELVRSLGADRALDYTQDDFCSGEERYELIFDAVSKISARQCKGVLAETGKFISVRTPTKEETEYLDYLREPIEAGQVWAVIDRRYSLAETAEAHRYVETGRKKGNVVIQVVAKGGK